MCLTEMTFKGHSRMIQNGYLILNRLSAKEHFNHQLHFTLFDLIQNLVNSLYRTNDYRMREFTLSFRKRLSLENLNAKLRDECIV